MTDNVITVLLVDDNAANLEILENYLGDSGYTLVSAHDGVEALEKLTCEPHRYHSSLLDLMMPRMTGMEVLQHMKAHPILMHVPAIIQTAAASLAEITEGLAAGAHYYLTKPFNKADLLAILTTAIRNRSAYLAVQKELDRTSSTLQLLHNGTFRFQTPDEALRLAALLGACLPRSVLCRDRPPGAPLECRGARQPGPHLRREIASPERRTTRRGNRPPVEGPALCGPVRSGHVYPAPARSSSLDHRRRVRIRLEALPPSRSATRLQHPWPGHRLCKERW